MNTNIDRPTVLQPGLLVSLSVRVAGGVEYTIREIEAEHQTEAGAHRARWETERIIADRAEHERAEKARSEARAAITATCARSSFGLLCPTSAEPKLRDAIQRARDIARAFNDSAKTCELRVNVLTGEIASNDAEALAAIKSELSELLAEMTAGIGSRDVDKIRAAAKRARDVSRILDDAAQQRAAAAIKAARDIANEIAKRARDGADLAEVQITEAQAQAIDSARIAFLDLDDAAPVEAAPGADAARAAGLDITSELDEDNEDRAALAQQAQPARPLDTSDAPPVTMAAAPVQRAFAWEV